MRILMLSPELPWPLNMGSKVRIYYTLRELARAGHEVTLLSLSHEPYGREEMEALRPHCAGLSIVPAPKRPRMKAAWRALLSGSPYRVAKFESPEFREQVVRALCNQFDVLWVHFLETLAYLPKEPGWRKKPVLVLDQHNADERFWATYARQGLPWVRFFAMQNLWRLRRFQRGALRKVDVVLSVSEEDAAFTQTRLPNPSTEIWVVPNGVDTEQLRPCDDERKQNRVIFCGAMDILMNIDAVEQFAWRIFPRIRKAIPDAEFWIVGRDPVPRVRALEALPGVHVTGRVQDVRPYYAEAKVAVAPFRYGGGTKLKVLEAMALGVPVVATPLGSQGIEAIPARHLLVEESEDMFADRVVALLQDEALRKEMAAEARRLVEQRYSWQSVLREAVARLERYTEAKAK